MLQNQIRLGDETQNLHSKTYLIPCFKGARARGGMGISKSWVVELRDNGLPEFCNLLRELSLPILSDS